MSRESPRLKVQSVDAEREQGSRTRVTVILEGPDGRVHETTARGVGGRIIELRLAAEATLEAASRAIGRRDRLELVGIKRIHAFDDEVILVAVRRSEDAGRSLLGAVPLGETPAGTAVRATLDAVNRILGPRLSEGGAPGAEAGRSEDAGRARPAGGDARPGSGGVTP